MSEGEISDRKALLLLPLRIQNLENLVEELKDKDAHPVVYTYRDAHAVSLGLRYGVGFLLLFISTRVFPEPIFQMIK